MRLQHLSRVMPFFVAASPPSQSAPRFLRPLLSEMDLPAQVLTNPAWISVLTSISYPYALPCDSASLAELAANLDIYFPWESRLARSPPD